jgi:hypothetical protein
MHSCDTTKESAMQLQHCAVVDTASYIRTGGMAVGPTGSKMVISSTCKTRQCVCVGGEVKVVAALMQYHQSGCRNARLLMLQVDANDNTTQQVAHRGR